MSHQLPLREIFLVLLVIEHFIAGIDLLYAKLRSLVVVVCDVDVVIVVVYAGRVRVVVVDEGRLRLDVVSDVLPVLVDDVVGVLEVLTRCWLSHLSRVVELLLLLLKLKGLLLLLLTILGSVAVLLAFSFALSIRVCAVVRCALWPDQVGQKKRK